MGAALRREQADLFADEAEPLPAGIGLLRGWVGPGRDRAMLDAMMDVFAAAPPYRLKMRSGAYVINRMTNCGAWGWHSDSRGYRYVDRHPETDMLWPAIPADVTASGEAAARACGVAGFEPDACLVNLYEAAGRMGQHQDHDEADFGWPIVSFSFGADAVFALGGATRKAPVRDIVLHHGDVLVMHGPARMSFHGVKRIVPGTVPFAHPAIPESGRLNLTLRRAR